MYKGSQQRGGGQSSRGRGGRDGGRWDGGEGGRSGYSNRGESCSSNAPRGSPPTRPRFSYSMNRGGRSLFAMDHVSGQKRLMSVEDYEEQQKIFGNQEPTVERAADAVPPTPTVVEPNNSNSANNNAVAVVAATICKPPGGENVSNKEAVEQKQQSPVEKSVGAAQKETAQKDDDGVVAAPPAESVKNKRKNLSVTFAADLTGESASAQEKEKPPKQDETATVEKTVLDMVPEEESVAITMDSVKKTVAVMANSTSMYVKNAAEAYAEQHTENKDQCKGCPHCNTSKEAIRTFAALMGTMAAKFKEFADSFGGSE